MLTPEKSVNTSPTPLVSVAITAYNSEKWLARALDSVIAQNVDFPIEIWIGDDCSQDGTLAVANAYRTRFPEQIMVSAQPVNIGMQRNYFTVFEHCRGKYIAWLDADDFWTDTNKLRIQAAALEADRSLSACGHFVRWITGTGEVHRESYPGIPSGRYGLEQITRHNFLPSPSVMFRNGIHRGLPAWYFDLAPTTDWPIWVLAAMTGDILLIDRVMADYMMTPGSSFTSKGELFWYKADIRFFDHILSILPSRWQRLARAERGRRYEAMAYALRKQGQFVASRKAAISAFRSPLLMDNLGTKSKALFAATVREIEWRIGGSKTPA
jgi:glycosyltransferase involved in cell wall biosynthesis